MAIAEDLLRRRGMAIAEVAERTGYGSASAFSTAFSRHVGQPPGRYASPANKQPTAAWTSPARAAPNLSP